jgi:hypothetical protein
MDSLLNKMQTLRVDSEDVTVKRKLLKKKRSMVKFLAPLPSIKKILPPPVRKMHSGEGHRLIVRWTVDGEIWDPFSVANDIDDPYNMLGFTVMQHLYKVRHIYNVKVSRTLAYVEVELREMKLPDPLAIYLDKKIITASFYFNMPIEDVKKELEPPLIPLLPSSSSLKRSSSLVSALAPAPLAPLASLALHDQDQDQELQQPPLKRQSSCSS